VNILLDVVISIRQVIIIYHHSLPCSHGAYAN